MRKLFLVPIIHTRSDMGSIAPVLSEISINAFGKEFWESHQTTVSEFWDSIVLFFKSLEVQNFKVYQDGLVIAGEEGLKIINEGAKQGSANYKIISDLILRGAILMKTEDLGLVHKEYDYIKKLTLAKSTREIKSAASKYKSVQNKLLENRDKFIAGEIQNTLKNDETGILFIGAYHNVVSKLPGDINVVQVKEIFRISEYHKILTNFDSQKGERFQQLAEYLAAPVSIVEPKKQ